MRTDQSYRLSFSVHYFGYKLYWLDRNAVFSCIMIRLCFLRKRDFPVLLFPPPRLSPSRRVDHPRNRFQFVATWRSPSPDSTLRHLSTPIDTSRNLSSSFETKVSTCSENCPNHTLYLPDILSMTIGGSRGGRARRAPPHLPGILVFDDILGHIV